MVPRRIMLVNKLLPLAHFQWRRPGAEFGGHGKIVRGPRFLNYVFSYLYYAKCSFLLCSYFRVHPTTLLLKILGGRIQGPSPPQIFLGTVPPVPLGLRPYSLKISALEICSL